MAKLLKLRRGTTTQHSSFTGAEGEVTIDVDKDVPVVHDGSTAGGHPVAAEDLANVSSATIVGRLNAASIPPVNIASGALPTNVTVTTANITNLTVATEDIANGAVSNAKIVDNAINNAKVVSDAAIAGTKISPDFGSQDVTTTGNIVLDSNSNKLKLGDGQELLITHNGSQSIITDTAHPVFLKGNQVHIQSANGNMFSGYQDAQVELFHNESKKFATTSTGVDVTGNIAVSGTVDGVDIAAIGVSNGAIASATTATTQAASDNSTKVATTAYVTTAVNNLVDSAPGALNTLNELAAAMGDDANFSTTVTNSIATKFANGGGSTITGDFSIASGTTNKNITVDVSDKIRFDDNLKAEFGNGGDLAIYHNGTDSIIDNGTNNLEIVTQNSMLFKTADAESAITCNKHGSVDLYHDNSKKFETMSNGIKSTDRIYADGGVIGRDATDLFNFINNDRIEVYINDSQEFRFEGDGDFHADGDVIAFSTTIASDERLKENIEIVPDALDKVEALRGVTFDWKRDGKSSAGVIAQEVMGVLPEAVKEVQGLNDNESHLTVNYHALTSILIESIKELSARVKELEAK